MLPNIHFFAFGGGPPKYPRNSISVPNPNPVIQIKGKINFK
jgi:hypothetical protein